MYRSIKFIFCFASLCIAANACQMDDIHRYGDRCKDWAYIQTEAGACSKDNLDVCGSDYVFALNAGYCPDKYNKCAYDKDGAKFCRTGCPDEGQVLCNKLCISEADYQNAIVEQREDGELCTPVTITCPDYCVNGCDKEGKCRCPGNCQSCDANGACLITCPENCVNGCGRDGACLCPQLCANGCDENGACVCSKDCVLGCSKDGSCLTPGDCKNGVDETGKCTCSPDCLNGCEADGACVCPRYCVSGCDDKGESCTCPESCTNGCNENGACKDLCNSDGECKNVNEYCDMGNCVAEKDENGNHLSDRYETAVNQGKACRRYSDCDSEVGKGDGFCDSFIGYKCSTRCTSDAQCFPHLETSEEPYKFVCREDGRCAPDSFITVWKIPENDKTLTLPVGGSNYDIDWGDGKQSLCRDDEICGFTHDYTSVGEYTVIIKGKTFSYGYFSQKEGQIKKAKKENPKLIEVKAFGPVRFSPDYVFAYNNIVKLSQIDIPNANGLNGYNMFAGPTSFNYPLNNWDTSKVTDMRSMFQDATSFNQPLDSWDTSKVTSMMDMFRGATAFNQPLDSWDTSNVTDMSYMFNNAKSFNQPLNNWDTSNVTEMGVMFNDATSFNQPLDSWDTSNVTSMSFMFGGAIAFDQPLNNWDTSNVTYMYDMFEQATSFNQPLNNWDTSNVIDMSFMFQHATSFNQPLNNWDTSNVINMDGMFQYSPLFDQDLSSWTVKASVTMMFDNSGLSKENYCKIQASQSWSKKPSHEYECE